MTSISVKTDIQKELTIFTIIGEISVHDIISAIEKNYSSDPTSLALWDFTEALNTDITSNQITTILHTVSKVINNRPNPKTALVFGNKYGFGMGRMYEILAESEHLPMTIRTFYDFDEAHSWLFSE